MIRIIKKIPTSREQRFSHPAANAEGTGRPLLFDPALKHCDNGFVAGPPEDAAARATMIEVRRQLLDRCLHALGGSALRDSVVVRGSATLAHWFPQRARPARDIDLVVRDATMGPDDGRATALLEGIAQCAHDALRKAGATMVGDVALDSIWTYERAEGRRLTLPWSFAGVARDAIQVDVVFREPMVQDPELHPLRIAQSAAYRPPEASLWFATRMESLAWKLLWIESDTYPEGKDVYDAILLAESTAVSRALLQRVFKEKKVRFPAVDPSEWTLEDVEWSTFAVECPHLNTRSPEEWRSLFRSALRMDG